MEPGLLGWELAIDRRTLGVQALPEVTRHICEAAAEGIRSLGVAAHFRRATTSRSRPQISGTAASSTATPCSSRAPCWSTWTPA